MKDKKNYVFRDTMCEGVVWLRDVRGNLAMVRKKEEVEEKFSQTSKKRNVMSLLGAVIF